MLHFTARVVAFCHVLLHFVVVLCFRVLLRFVLLFTCSCVEFFCVFFLGGGGGLSVCRVVFCFVCCDFLCCVDGGDTHQKFQKHPYQS